MQRSLSIPIARDALDRREREVAELAREQALRRTERDGSSPTHVSRQSRMRWLRLPRRGVSISEAGMSRYPGIEARMGRSWIAPQFLLARWARGHRPLC
jgi:hypothetical protein